jgi:hypothetical protein
MPHVFHDWPCRCRKSSPWSHIALQSAKSERIVHLIGEILPGRGKQAMLGHLYLIPIPPPGLKSRRFVVVG